MKPSHEVHECVECRCQRCGAVRHEWGSWEPLRTPFYDVEQRRCVREGCPATETWVLPD